MILKPLSISLSIKVLILSIEKSLCRDIFNTYIFAKTIFFFQVESLLTVILFLECNHQIFADVSDQTLNPGCRESSHCSPLDAVLDPVYRTCIAHGTLSDSSGPSLLATDTFKDSSCPSPLAPGCRGSLALAKDFLGQILVRNLAEKIAFSEFLFQYRII